TDNSKFHAKQMSPGAFHQGGSQSFEATRRSSERRRATNVRRQIRAKRMDRPAPEVRNYAVIFPRLQEALLCGGGAQRRRHGTHPGRYPHGRVTLLAQSLTSRRNDVEIGNAKGTGS